MVSAGQNIKIAKRLLAERPHRKASPHVALAAAALAASAAVLLAGVMVIGPGFTIEEAEWSVAAQR